MKARDIMTADPVTVTPERPVRDAAALMSAHDISILPVVEASATRRIVGVISDRDIVERCVAAGHAGDCRVADHMTSSRLETVGLDDDVEVVLKTMAVDLAHRLPVMDEDGRISGIITYSDVVTRLKTDGSPLRRAIVERVPGALGADGATASG
jgi:CBS domain-containing protein